MLGRLSITNSNEILCAIYLALALLDIPSLERPQGWFLQVNCVCRHWRYVAVGYAELRAISAGFFPSDDMTQLAIERAGKSTLCLDGHFEDHDGAGYVLTEHQLSLIEEYRDCLRSLVHDDDFEWPELLNRSRTFPKLEMARIWDESGPSRWNVSALIAAPRLCSLYMNNVFIPFDAPMLRHLCVDMDNCNWSSSRNALKPLEPVAEGCEATRRVFPTDEFIAFLQRSPQLERLIVTDMPFLCAEDLPSVSALHAELPRLSSLHIGGQSLAMGDFLRRLRVPKETSRLFIDTELPNGFEDWEPQPVLLTTLLDWIQSSVNDSTRLSLTLSYDVLLQL